MNSSKDNVGYFYGMPVYEGRLSTDLSSDFTLPDYQSEIRRLLCIRAQAVPESEFLGMGNAELSGKIIYKVMYVGADGKLYSVSLSENYTFSLPFELGSHTVSADDVTVFSTVSSDNASARVLGPRKLNVKCKVICRALALTPMLYTPARLGGVPSGAMEELLLNTESISAQKYSLDPLTLSDKAPLDPSADNARVVACEHSVQINDSSASGGRINVSGEVILKILYCNDAESEHPICITRRIPFSQSAYCEGSNTECDILAKAFVTDEQIFVDESGINAELTLALVAELQKNEITTYVADAYSTGVYTEGVFSEISVMSALKPVSANLTQSEMHALDEIKLPHDIKIIDVFANVRASEVSRVEGDRLSLAGECVYQVLYYHNDEYLVKELCVPYKYDLDSRYKASAEDYLLCIPNVCVTSARARHDGERMFTDCELSISVDMQRSSQAKILSEIICEERIDKDDGAITLCYPNKGENLWSVAKRYAEPLNKIRSQNAINDGDISKKTFLII